MAGAVVGVVLLILAVIILFVVLRRRRDKRQERELVFAEGETLELSSIYPMAGRKTAELEAAAGAGLQHNPIYAGAAPSPSAVLSGARELPRSAVHLLVGLGSPHPHYTLSSGRLAGQDSLVTVKSIAGKPGSEQASAAGRRLLEEAWIVEQLGSHPGITALLGYVTASSPPLLVFEALPNAAVLTAYLRDAADAPPRPRRLADLLLAISDAMAFLAFHNIVHRNLVWEGVGWEGGGHPPHPRPTVVIFSG